MTEKTYNFKTKNVDETEKFGYYIAKTLDEGSFGSAFIALLFLAREDEYELFQEEFYGKLFVKKAQPSEQTGDEN